MNDGDILYYTTIVFYAIDFNLMITDSYKYNTRSDEAI